MNSQESYCHDQATPTQQTQTVGSSDGIPQHFDGHQSKGQLSSMTSIRNAENETIQSRIRMLADMPSSSTSKSGYEDSTSLEVKEIHLSSSQEKPYYDGHYYTRDNIKSSLRIKVRPVQLIEDSTDAQNDQNGQNQDFQHMSIQDFFNQVPSIQPGGAARMSFEQQDQNSSTQGSLPGERRQHRLVTLNTSSSQSIKIEDMMENERNLSKQVYEINKQFESQQESYGNETVEDGNEYEFLEKIQEDLEAEERCETSNESEQGRNPQNQSNGDREVQYGPHQSSVAVVGASKRNSYNSKNSVACHSQNYTFEGQSQKRTSYNSQLQDQIERDIEENERKNRELQEKLDRIKHNEYQLQLNELHMAADNVNDIKNFRSFRLSYENDESQASHGKIYSEVGTGIKIKADPSRSSEPLDDHQSPNALTTKSNNTPVVKLHGPSQQPCGDSDKQNYQIQTVGNEGTSNKDNGAVRSEQMLTQIISIQNSLKEMNLEPFSRQSQQQVSHQDSIKNINRSSCTDNLLQDQTSRDFLNSEINCYDDFHEKFNTTSLEQSQDYMPSEQFKNRSLGLQTRLSSKIGSQKADQAAPSDEYGMANTKKPKQGKHDQYQYLSFGWAEDEQLDSIDQKELNNSNYSNLDNQYQNQIQPEKHQRTSSRCTNNNRSGVNTNPLLTAVMSPQDDNKGKGQNNGEQENASTNGQQLQMQPNIFSKRFQESEGGSPLTNNLTQQLSQLAQSSSINTRHQIQTGGADIESIDTADQILKLQDDYQSQKHYQSASFTGQQSINSNEQNDKEKLHSILYQIKMVQSSLQGFSIKQNIPTMNIEAQLNRPDKLTREELLKVLESLTNAYKDASQRLFDAINQLHKREKIIQSQCDQIDSFSVKEKKVVESLDKYKDYQKEISNQVEELRSRHEKETIKYKKDNQIFQQSLNKSEIIINSLKEKNVMLNSENDYLKKQLQTTRDQLERYQNKTEQLTQTFEMNSKQMESMKHQVEVKDQYIAEMKQNLESFNDKLTSLEEERNKLLQELETRDSIETQNELLKNLESLVVDNATINSSLYCNTNKQATIQNSTFQHQSETALIQAPNSSNEFSIKAANDNNAVLYSQCEQICSLCLNGLIAQGNRYHANQTRFDPMGQRHQLISGEYALSPGEDDPENVNKGPLGVQMLDNEMNGQARTQLSQYEKTQQLLHCSSQATNLMEKPNNKELNPDLNALSEPEVLNTNGFNHNSSGNLGLGKGLLRQLGQSAASLGQASKQNKELDSRALLTEKTIENNYARGLNKGQIGQMNTNSGQEISQGMTIVSGFNASIGQGTFDLAQGSQQVGQSRLQMQNPAFINPSHLTVHHQHSQQYSIGSSSPLLRAGTKLEINLFKTQNMNNDVAASMESDSQKRISQAQLKAFKRATKQEMSAYSKLTFRRSRSSTIGARSPSRKSKEEQHGTFNYSTMYTNYTDQLQQQLSIIQQNEAIVKKYKHKLNNQDKMIKQMEKDHKSLIDELKQKIKDINKQKAKISTEMNEKEQRGHQKYLQLEQKYDQTVKDHEKAIDEQLKQLEDLNMKNRAERSFDDKSEILKLQTQISNLIAERDSLKLKVQELEIEKDKYLNELQLLQSLNNQAQSSYLSQNMQVLPSAKKDDSFQNQIMNELQKLTNIIQLKEGHPKEQISQHQRSPQRGRSPANKTELRSNTDFFGGSLAQISHGETHRRSRSNSRKDAPQIKQQQASKNNMISQEKKSIMELGYNPQYLTDINSIGEMESQQKYMNEGTLILSSVNEVTDQPEFRDLQGRSYNKDYYLQRSQFEQTANYDKFLHNQKAPQKIINDQDQYYHPNTMHGVQQNMFGQTLPIESSKININQDMYKQQFHQTLQQSLQQTPTTVGARPSHNNQLQTPAAVNNYASSQKSSIDDNAPLNMPYDYKGIMEPYQNSQQPGYANNNSIIPNIQNHQKQVYSYQSYDSQPKNLPPNQPDRFRSKIDEIGLHANQEQLDDNKQQKRQYAQDIKQKHENQIHQRRKTLDQFCNISNREEQNNTLAQNGLNGQPNMQDHHMGQHMHLQNKADYNYQSLNQDYRGSQDRRGRQAYSSNLNQIKDAIIQKEHTSNHHNLTQQYGRVASTSPVNRVQENAMITVSAISPRKRHSSESNSRQQYKKPLLTIETQKTVDGLIRPQTSKCTAPRDSSNKSGRLHENTAKRRERREKGINLMDMIIDAISLSTQNDYDKHNRNQQERQLQMIMQSSQIQNQDQTIIANQVHDPKYGQANFRPLRQRSRGSSQGQQQPRILTPIRSNSQETRKPGYQNYQRPLSSHSITNLSNRSNKTLHKQHQYQQIWDSYEAMHQKRILRQHIMGMKDERAEWMQRSFDERDSQKEMDNKFFNQQVEPRSYQVLPTAQFTPASPPGAPGPIISNLREQQQIPRTLADPMHDQNQQDVAYSDYYHKPSHSFQPPSRQMTQVPQIEINFNQNKAHQMPQLQVKQHLISQIPENKTDRPYYGNHPHYRPPANTMAASSFQSSAHQSSKSHLPRVDCRRIGQNMNSK